jgi:hypothetical protein
MLVGDRLRELREQKKLSQGHIEKRTGLSVAMSQGLRTATLFRALVRLRNWRVHWTTKGRTRLPRRSRLRSESEHPLR